MTDPRPAVTPPERGVAPDDPVHTALVRVLGEIQRRGGIGRGSAEVAVAHAEHFVAALPHDLPAGTRVVDLGSGGGLPGLVIVARRPDLQVTLVERRAKRADLLSYGVRALDASDRVRVVAGDAERLASDEANTFDVVTARSFAAPPVLLDLARRLLTTGGWLLVAEPPELPDDRDPATTRWQVEDLQRAALVDDGRWGAVRRFHRGA